MDETLAAAVSSIHKPPMTIKSDEVPFRHMIQANAQSEIWNHTSSDHQGMTEDGWRAGRNKDGYSLCTLMGNWVEKRNDVEFLKIPVPPPSQYDHYYSTEYGTSYNTQPKFTVPEVLRNLHGRHPHAFPSHQPEVDTEKLKAVYNSWRTTYRSEYLHPALRHSPLPFPPNTTPFSDLLNGEDRGMSKTHDKQLREQLLWTEKGKDPQQMLLPKSQPLILSDGQPMTPAAKEGGAFHTTKEQPQDVSGTGMDMGEPTPSSVQNKPRHSATPSRPGEGPGTESSTKNEAMNPGENARAGVLSSPPSSSFADPSKNTWLHPPSRQKPDNQWNMPNSTKGELLHPDYRQQAVDFWSRYSPFKSKSQQPAELSRWQHRAYTGILPTRNPRC